jgi:succinyl-CoA synthetase beta subunit
MARERISEWGAKRMILGDAYTGISLTGSNDPIFVSVPEKHYVIKVDQGIKKRFLQGLLKTNVSKTEVETAMDEWEAKGYSQFLLEEYIPHNDTEERYLSFERVREGIQVLWGTQGGVAVESHGGTIEQFLLDTTSRKSLIEKGIPLDFIARIESLLNTEYVSFIEINPILITASGVTLLDAAVLVDGAGLFFTKAWRKEDLIATRSAYTEEATVARLQRTTAASLKLNVMNPDGALFFLLSGGGASIVALDAVHEAGAGKLIGNYGEYSGGPTREETYLYSKEVLSLLLKSHSPKKALVIAGGVANFTDVRDTFAGVIDALREVAGDMRAANIKVFVRRGGPNEAQGLHAMEEFLMSEDLLGEVVGSLTPIVTPVIHAVEYVSQTSSHTL